jgi:hypothetical protein
MEIGSRSVKPLVYQSNMGFDSNSGLRNWQRSATEDLWERTLNQLPSKMGKLAYLSRLRNLETDRYEHHGLSAVFGEASAEDALRKSHEEVLMSWLSLGILDQTSDVRAYMEALPQSALRLLANWEKSKGYEALLPPGASEAQRTLFDANMTLIIRHLKAEFSGGQLNRE